MTDPEQELEQDGGPLRRTGDLLVEGREALGLSADDVARHLRLDPKVVVALESERYEDLAAPAYVRGYLRNYGRLINVPEDMLVAGYEAQASTAPDIAPFSSTPAVQAKLADIPVRAFTYLVVIGLAGLLALWWSNQSRQAENAETVETQELTRLGPATADQSSRAVELSGDPPISSGSKQVIPAYPDVLAPPTGTGEAQVERPLDAITAEIPQPVVSVPPTIEDGAIVAVGEPSEALVLNLGGQAWIEIYDAEKKRLYFDMGKPDETISVQGVLPYQVIIGNSAEVDASLGGQPIDFSSQVSAGIARFHLQSDGLVVP